MCGIAGFSTPPAVDPDEQARRFGAPLRAMVASLRHRGPDALRGLLLDGIALGHARLSIVDVSGGAQPMRDDATGVTLVFNGEVFNHVELRDHLQRHRVFRTRSDTEVLLAAYLEQGIECLGALNGQFAFAIWDPRDRTLWLARDRVGICPLMYVRTPYGIAFASEARALFAGGFAAPELDAAGLKQTLTTWSPVTPRTSFEGVRALPAAHVARLRDGALTSWRYWDVDLDPASRIEDLGQAASELSAVLDDAVRLRLRADVPVAAYLSGGLDSSVVCASAQSQLGGTLSTFSVGFEEGRYDERRFQHEVATAIATDHRSVAIRARDIGGLLPEAVAHGEQALLRSAPAPLLRLSRLVREAGIKVVLTGEGADEVFLGYDLYRETTIRAFWARQPSSRARPALLARLYPYLPLTAQGRDALRQFFGIGLDEPAAPAFSHLVRWTASARVLRFLSPTFAARCTDEDPVASVLESVPSRVRSWPPLERAQYLEMQTLLAGYLLSAQGDRVLMANSVEGRFPFLDHRLIELAARMRRTLKLRALQEKRVLKRVAAGRIPASVLGRKKFPYRAPVSQALVGPEAPAWARSLLGRDAVAAYGIFDAELVDRLVKKLAARPPETVTEADNMALTAVASTQLLADYLRSAPWAVAAAREVVTVGVA